VFGFQRHARGLVLWDGVGKSHPSRISSQRLEDNVARDYYGWPTMFAVKGTYRGMFTFTLIKDSLKNTN
jgi:hypothetical protein